jgi:CheY-like chemotaxis protein
VVGDRARLRQILVNLLGNAVKFTPTGVVALTVDGQVSQAGQWRLTFEVRDSGIGIAADVVERLFSPFVQADSSTTRCFGGSGLGLAISKRLIAVMGGDITVLSAPGQGATFRVTLTLDPAPEALPAALITSPDAFTVTHLATLKVLVAEDDPNNQKVIRLLLHRLGIAADLVANGQQAVETARSAAYDIIILDLQMPVMDGLEASRHIRALDLPKRPTLVALTANAFQEDREATRAAGMDEYLSKPITLASLRGMLVKITHPAYAPYPAMPQPPPAISAMPPAEPMFIDTQQLDTFIDIGTVGYHDILGDLIRDIPDYLSHLRDTIQTGDAAALKRRLHSLRGILACFGCVTMTTRLAQLELHANIPPERASPLHAELHDLWQQSLSAIRAWERSVPAFTSSDNMEL